ncbi:unnamed protein product [Protopolystoma xenopodis]|uniref:C2H2-type domain-containing protein n=1 Tax=Protopolystoma xenopodis TaxID=117903 RepID=A0A3S5CH95_9PLAT|nr:unnamed protein product [Protopolystoma xenopodis]
MTEPQETANSVDKCNDSSESTEGNAPSATTPQASDQLTTSEAFVDAPTSVSTTSSTVGVKIEPSIAALDLLAAPPSDAHRFKCIFCPRWFTQFHHLSKHARALHPESADAVTNAAINAVEANGGKVTRTWSCPVCWREFGKLANLRIHSRTHTGERPYGCIVCSRRFTQLSSLRTHQRMHSGDRRHRCPVCAKEFLTSSNLRSHMRTHTGERPYTCNVCGRQFGDHSGMKRHEKTHNKNCSGIPIEANLLNGSKATTSNISLLSVVPSVSMTSALPTISHDGSMSLSLPLTKVANKPEETTLINMPSIIGQDIKDTITLSSGDAIKLSSIPGHGGHLMSPHHINVIGAPMNQGNQQCITLTSVPNSLSSQTLIKTSGGTAILPENTVIVTSMAGGANPLHGAVVSQHAQCLPFIPIMSTCAVNQTLQTPISSVALANSNTSSTVSVLSTGANCAQRNIPVKVGPISVFSHTIPGVNVSASNQPRQLTISTQPHHKGGTIQEVVQVGNSMFATGATHAISAQMGSIPSSLLQSPGQHGTHLLGAPPGMPFTITQSNMSMMPSQLVGPGFATGMPTQVQFVSNPGANHGILEPITQSQLLASPPMATATGPGGVAIASVSGLGGQITYQHVNPNHSQLASPLHSVDAIAHITPMSSSPPSLPTCSTNSLNPSATSIGTTLTQAVSPQIAGMSISLPAFATQSSQSGLPSLGTVSMATPHQAQIFATAAQQQLIEAAGGPRGQSVSLVVFPDQIKSGSPC